MIQLPENFDSIFRYIEVVSQRAEQIIKGARPRSDVRRAKSTLQARDDVDAGTVEWRVLTQEELDAQRQAMVEQFRAEMESVEEEATESTPTVDVLPTSGGKTPAVEAGGLGAPEDTDDELQRLQRLLGMAGATIPDIVEEAPVEVSDSVEKPSSGDAGEAEPTVESDDSGDDKVDEKD